MKRVHLLLLLYGVLAALTGCQQLTPLSPAPLDERLEKITQCQPPPLEKNIIGTWRYEATYGMPENQIRQGTLTFDAQGVMSDPDTLFEAVVQGHRVVKNTYQAKVRMNLFGTEADYVEIQSTVVGGWVRYYFLPVANACDFIKLNNNGSRDDQATIRLYRLSP